MKKNNLFRNSIVFLLILTMLSGQAMTGVALAANIDGIPLFTEDNVEVTEEKTESVNQENASGVTPVIPVEPQEEAPKEEAPQETSSLSSPLTAPLMLNPTLGADPIEDGKGGISIQLESKQAPSRTVTIIDLK